MSKLIEDLSIAILRHNELYTAGTPEISDKEYDSLIAELRKLDPEHPTLAEVGADMSYGKKVKHTEVMGSLDKVFSAQEVVDRFASLGIKRIVAAPKIDGLAVELHYSGGRLVRAVTRGNGEVGQDVTDNVRQIKSIPQDVPGLISCRLRGEIYMKRSVFNELRDSGGRVFANPRNAAAGSLNQKDAEETGKRKLDFLCYDARDVGSGAYPEQTESCRRECIMKALNGVNFVDMSVAVDTSNKHEIEDIIKTWAEYRPNIDYEIDGIVFSANELEEQDTAGMHGKCPWGKVAFKFPAEQIETIVEGIDRQIGRLGKATPVARLKPILLAGSTISNISLHNEAYVREYGITIGSTVLIEKAGDIIPQVVRVTQRVDGLGIGETTKCPACGGELEMDERDVALWCRNPSCPAQLVEKINHFFETFEIKGVGDSMIQHLCSAGLLKGFSDVYRLTEEKLVGVGFGKKVAANAIAAINGRRKVSLAVFLDALGIDGLGTSTSKALAAKFKRVEDILALGLDDILNAGIPGVAGKTATKIKTGLTAMYDTIDELLLYVDAEDVVEVVGKLSGMSFCLTGAMPSGRKRADVEKQIEAAGGMVKSSVGKGLTYLVQADPSSTSDKTQKAEKFGTKIISEDELMSLMA